MISDPSVYVGCINTLAKFVKVVKDVPSKIESKMESMIHKVKDLEIYQNKIDYLKSLVNFLGDKVDKWTVDLQKLADSPNFDFLELKPLIHE